jgi:hypothetical protein
MWGICKADAPHAFYQEGIMNNEQQWRIIKVGIPEWGKLGTDLVRMSMSERGVFYALLLTYNFYRQTDREFYGARDLKTYQLPLDNLSQLCRISGLNTHERTVKKFLDKYGDALSKVLEAQKALEE